MGGKVLFGLYAVKGYRIGFAAKSAISSSSIGTSRAFDWNITHVNKLPASLHESPLWQRGARGDFLMTINHSFPHAHLITVFPMFHGEDEHNMLCIMKLIDNAVIAESQRELSLMIAGERLAAQGVFRKRFDFRKDPHKELPVGFVERLKI